MRSAVQFTLALPFATWPQISWAARMHQIFASMVVPDSFLWHLRAESTNILQSDTEKMIPQSQDYRANSCQFLWSLAYVLWYTLNSELLGRVNYLVLLMWRWLGLAGQHAWFSVVQWEVNLLWLMWKCQPTSLVDSWRDISKGPGWIAFKRVEKWSHANLMLCCMDFEDANMWECKLFFLL